MIKYFLFLSIFFVGCANKISKTETSVSKKPNILLIVIDDLGYADFDPFNNLGTKVSTPNMNRIAEAGRIFTQAYTTAPVCSPSRAGIITGKNQ